MVAVVTSEAKASTFCWMYALALALTALSEASIYGKTDENFSLENILKIQLRTTPAAHGELFPQLLAMFASILEISVLIAVFRALKRALMVDNCWLNVLVTRDVKSVMLPLIDP